MSVILNVINLSAGSLNGNALKRIKIGTQQVWPPNRALLFYVINAVYTQQAAIEYHTQPNTSAGVTSGNICNPANYDPIPPVTQPCYPVIALGGENLYIVFQYVSTRYCMITQVRTNISFQATFTNSSHSNAFNMFEVFTDIRHRDFFELDLHY
jgi:hypothetical protein